MLGQLKSILFEREVLHGKMFVLVPNFVTSRVIFLKISREIDYFSREGLASGFVGK